MQKIATICLTICIATLSYAQNDWKAISDSLALESRAKADIAVSYTHLDVYKRQM